MIGIIGALSIETDELIFMLDNRQAEIISGIKYVHGFLYGKEVVVAKCGIGKVFAGICVQTMILKYDPKVIINTGVAGGLDSSLKVYDLVIADELVQHDMDTSGLGDPLGMISGLDIVEIPCARKLVDEFCGCADKLAVNYRVGRIATGDQFVSNRKRIDEIVGEFSAIACEMEGGAIAQVCYVNNVDFIVVRCISDLADEESSIDYLSFAKGAADRSLKLLLEYLSNKA